MSRADKENGMTTTATAAAAIATATATAGRDDDDAAISPDTGLAVVVVAAGRSSRMGGTTRLSPQSTASR